MDPQDNVDGTLDITIEDDNVLREVEDILVQEEVVDASATIRLNKDQIMNELTHLLFDRYQSTISHKVESYYDLVSQPPASQFLYPLPSKVMAFRQVSYLEDGVEGDVEFATQQNVTYDWLSSFLPQLHKLLHSQNSYPEVKARLDAFWSPVQSLSGDGISIPQNEEVYRFLFEKVQLPSLRALAGDKMDMKGFYVQNTPSTSYDTFDIPAYLEAMEALTTGAAVRVILRDFAWNLQGKVVEEVMGELVRKDATHVHVMDKTGSTHVFDATQVFVFPMESVIFRPEDLLVKNMYFPLSYAQMHLLNHVIPQNVSQFLFLHRSNLTHATNWGSIQASLQDIGYHPSTLPRTVEALIRKLIVKRYPPLVRKANPSFERVCRPVRILDFQKHKFTGYSHEGRFMDNEVARYIALHRNVPQEQAYILHVLQKYVDKWVRTHVNTLHDLEQHRQALLKDISQHVKTSSSCQDNKPIIVGKIYSRYDDMNQDTGKKIYFDNDLDKTEYHLKTKYPDVEELKGHLRSKHPEWSTLELSHEVDAIVSGRQRVREGDYAVLRNMGQDILFIRRMVEGKSMWIKVQRLPTPWCADSLYTMEELQQQPCLFYQKSCKELEALRKLLLEEQQQVNASLLEDAVYFLENAKIIEQEIHADMLHFHRLQSLLPTSSAPGVNPRVWNHVELDVEVTDMHDGEPLQDHPMVLEYGEQSHYAVMPVEKKKMVTHVSPVVEFLETFTTFLGIALDTEDIDFIQQWCNATQAEYIKERLAKWKAMLFKSVTMTQYQSNPKYKVQVDNMVASKLKNLEEEETYVYIIIQSMSMLVLLLMARYPQLLIHNIYPSCVRFLSYKGYPAYESSRQRSLARYFACLIKHITSTDDPRYVLLAKKTQDQIHNEMIHAMDSILQKHYQLHAKIEANKPVLEKHKAARTLQTTETWPGFKPVFDVSEQASLRDPAAKFVSELQELIKDKPHLKSSVFSTPAILNACCMEPLTPALNYYDMFSSLENIARKVPRASMTHTQSVIPPLRSLAQGFVPPSEELAFSKVQEVQHIANKPYPSDLLAKLDAFASANPLWQEDAILRSKKGDDADFWNDVVFANTMQWLEGTQTFVETVLDHADRNIFLQFKNMLVFMQDMNHLDNVRNTLYRYMTTHVPRILGKIVNGFSLSETQIQEQDKDLEVQLLVSFLRNKNIPKQFLDVLRIQGWNQVDHMWLHDQVVQNVSLLSYLFCKFMYMMLACFVRVPVSVEGISALDPSALLQSIMQPDEGYRIQVHLICSLVYYFYQDLVQQLQRNDINVTAVKKGMERLREQRKQDMMQRYAVDDEERELQMALKKLGVQTWYDVGGQGSGQEEGTTPSLPTQSDVDIMKHANQQEENTNYQTKEYQGENPDQDDEE